MYLDKISISNYKSIAQVDVSFSPVLNCFVGNNGEGKTNLLDSIYYLSMCKSHTLTTDNQNIKDKEDYFLLKGEYIRKESEDIISCGLKRSSTKSFKLNKKEYERLSDHIGYLPLVIIAPSDISLINESGEERRRFLNTVISQSSREYLSALMKYNRVLSQRNKLLKSNIIDNSLLEILNDQLSQYGHTVYKYRKDAVAQLMPIFKESYNKISGENEEVSLEYRSDLDKRELKDLLLENSEKDRILQHTSVGVHRDDLVMKINGRQLKKAGSQGQQKTFLIAMKLAEFSLIKSNLDETPILLLDDIFDKLDMSRVEKLISLVAENSFGQIFITDSNKHRLDLLLQNQNNSYKLFKLEKGEVELLNENN